jgi:hypothetical protein
MQEVHDDGLEVFPGYVALSASECAPHANGVGSAQMPEWSRELLSLLPFLSGAAFLHDLAGHFANDGSWSGYREWNATFRRNIRKKICKEISAWRFLARRAAYGYADACHAMVSSDTGWTAWRKAYEENVEPGPEVGA